MRVTIVHDSDDNASVHIAGCADITRSAERKRSFLSSYTIDAETKQDAANDAWSDFIGESMDEDGALSYTYFYPCCDHLLK
jgi:hypothetical protein